MTCIQRFPLSLLAVAALVPAIVLPDSGALAQAPRHANSEQHTLVRKTTDPPVPSQGKLGQDLFMAVGHGDMAAVRSLLKHGADPNARNGLLFTPLYIAAATGQTQAMEALIQAGANIEAASPYGTALRFAAMTGAVPSIKYLLARGANINPSRVDGTTPLMVVSRVGLAEIAGDLLRRKADVNGKDNDGATPLIYAAREGHMDVANVLLAGGADVKIADSHGWTPLMYAAVNGHADFVRLLLEKGGDPNTRDAKGQTALVLAANYGDHPDVIQALLKGGADFRAVDSSNRTAVSVAAAHGYSQCAKILEDAKVPPAVTAAGMTRTPGVAIQASLKLLGRSMRQFSERTGCVSCHQEGLGRWATGLAQERGFALDPAVDRAQVERINGGLNALKPLHVQALTNPEAMKQVPLIEIGEVATTYTWLLAGMAAHKQPANDATSAMAMVLARQQFPEGQWQFALPRVPMQSSFFTFTALAIRSLQAYGPRANAAEIAERIGRAKNWLLAAPTQTSEDRAFRLLGLKWAGASEDEIRKAAADLRAEQRPDGGWSQLANLQSDAYATGEALYALHTAGVVAVTDPVYERGTGFLLRTQDEDGSWFVSKRAIEANNYFDAGFPHGESQYSSFNGTCWATIALLQTVDGTHHAAARPTQ